MEGNDPKKIAFTTSFIISILYLAAFAVLFIFKDSKMLWVAIPTLIVVLGVIQYHYIHYTLKHLIFDRIRLIFKTIHKHKLRREDKIEQKLSMHGDIIKQVSDEVENWAKSDLFEIDELKKTEKFRREFLSNVSHELKTPLFNLQGFISTLIDGGINDENINIQYLDKSSKNIDRMITIVEDLEEISRLETGDVSPKFNEFQLVPLIKEIFELLEPKAKEKNISLIMGSENYDNISVYADAEKIRTVIMNLVENSIKYGNAAGRTKVSLYDMDDVYLIEVSDNGVGIEQEHIPRLFERFYRVDKHRSRSGGGSGLGLAIVKHIIEAHQQTINVRSTPGIGTTFSFTIAKPKKHKA